MFKTIISATVISNDNETQMTATIQSKI